MRTPFFSRLLAASSLALALALANAPAAKAQDTEPPPGPLTGIKPIAPKITPYVRDLLALQQLGKALFWDIKVGGDGQACASCHFHAGADIRLGNQVNPGHDGQFDQAKAGGTTGPNARLGEEEFPFRQLFDPDRRNSAILHDKNDRFSSQGTFGSLFVSDSRVGSDPVSNPLGTIDDRCFDILDETNNPFHTNGRMHRRVEPRQTPTVINAAFNHRQFWDGRANNAFNGVDPFGRRTLIKQQNAGLLFQKPDGTMSLKRILIDHASLASQAVGPPLSDFEMACQGARFGDLARRLMGKAPLEMQAVHAGDSLFSKTPGLVNSAGNGLTTTYAALIRKAFRPAYWRGNQRYVVNADKSITVDPLHGFKPIEHNFSLFFGLALMEYQRLLISDQTPFDQGTLSVNETNGLHVFLGKGKCINCHGGPLFTNAANIANNNPALVETMVIGDGTVARYDDGFYNIGVRPSSEDRGLGGKDPHGYDLSFTRQFHHVLNGKPQLAPDKFADKPAGPNPGFVIRDAVDGAFKTPGLRNVGLNPPYMHNGGQASLEQLVEFYDRGGDRRGPNPRTGRDTTGLGPNNSNLDPDIGNLGLSAQEKSDLVAFMKALTDNRVACHSGVFDHPALPLFDGHHPTQVEPGSVRAKDLVRVLPAVGETGLPGIGKPCFPNSGNLFGELQTAFDAIAPMVP